MDRYTCEACGGVFDSPRSEAEAIAEAVAVFGRGPAAGDMARVCDDCYRRIMAWAGDSVGTNQGTRQNPEPGKH